MYGSMFGYSSIGNFGMMIVFRRSEQDAIPRCGKVSLVIFDVDVASFGIPSCKNNVKTSRVDFSKSWCNVPSGMKELALLIDVVDRNEKLAPKSATSEKE